MGNRLLIFLKDYVFHKGVTNVVDMANKEEHLDISSATCNNAIQTHGHVIHVVRWYRIVMVLVPLPLQYHTVAFFSSERGPPELQYIIRSGTDMASIGRGLRMQVPRTRLV